MEFEPAALDQQGVVCEIQYEVDLRSTGEFDLFFQGTVGFYECRGLRRVLDRPSDHRRYGRLQAESDQKGDPEDHRGRIMPSFGRLGQR
jgi:hypothetical protein